MKNFLLTTCFIALSFISISQNIRYVIVGGTGNGISWQEASGDIQAMVNSSSSGDQVWVAEGTYILSATLHMKQGVNVYGGFDGTESSLEQRDWETNETILDGNYSVVVLYQVSTEGDYSESVWDGFTIQNGVSDANNAGAGAHLERGGTIINCKVINNQAVDFGGGIYTRKGARIENCYIANNYANNGGGLFLANGGTVINCRITQNEGMSGGGVVPYGGGEVVNCIIDRNTGIFGGGVYLAGGGTIVNSVITGNNASSTGGGIWSNYTQYGGPPSSVINTIIWNNISSGSDPQVSFSGTDNYAITNFAHCAIQDIGSITWDYIENTYNINLGPDNGGTDGPGFTDPALADYTLTASSPCINMGDNSYALFYQNDFYGNSRIRQGRIDIGANETDQGTAPTGHQRYYVSGQGNDANSGSSWSDAKLTLQAALNSAAETILPGTSIEVWVAEGTYTLTTSVEMKEAISVYGGFTGNESTIEERNWIANETILNADASSAIRRSIIQYPDFFGATTFDGFSLINGNVPGKGGAAIIRNNGVLKNCKIEYNAAGLRGGGVYLQEGGIIQNCTLANNTALIGGSAFFNYGGEMTASILENNSAELGGAICCENGGYIRNCLFRENNADYIGGGVCISFGADLVNCTFVNNNSHQSGGGMYGEYDNQMGGIGLRISNSIFWNNSSNGSGQQINLNGGNSHISLSNCAIQDIDQVIFGSTELHDNINLNAVNDDPDGPQFTDPGSGVFTLTKNSPCVNTGENNVVTDQFDLAGNDRIQGQTVDIGAYESPFLTAIPTILPAALFVQAYPNPATDRVTFDMAGTTGPVRVEIINSHGAMIQKTNFPVGAYDSKIELCLEEIPSGTIFIKVSSNEGIKIAKCVKR